MNEKKREFSLTDADLILMASGYLQVGDAQRQMAQEIIHVRSENTQLSTLYSNAIARAEKAEEALRRFAWQPIETAPRDGSIILTGGFAKNGWFIADAKFADGGWCQFDPRLDEYDVECDEPPYWLPLPPPPVRETP